MKGIIYEQPLNEHIRASLRLEQLFKKLEKIDELPINFTIKTLLDVVDVLNRTDLKAKWLQLFCQIKEQLNQWLKHKGVEQAVLEETLAQVNDNIKLLNQSHGKFAENLRQNPFLQQIKHGFNQTGSDTNFDIPSFHYWQSQEDFKLTVQNWINSLKPIKKVIYLLLNMLRHSRHFGLQTAKEGYYEHRLENSNCQMVRIKLAEELACYPEISTGRQKLAVRFYKPSLDKPVKTEKTEIEFELSECY